MKCPSIDESVSLCICLLTVACNREMQPFFKLAIRCVCVGGGYFGFGSGSKFNCAARVGSYDLWYRPGSGFHFKPVQTSNNSSPS